MLIYVDTSALIALVRKRDDFHKIILQTYKDRLDSSYHFITTDAVVLEIGNAFSSASKKPFALSIFQLIQQSSHWQCHPVDESLLEKSQHLFSQRMDKDWSLTDCMGIVVANEHQIQEIFTTDSHFTQAGFTILLPKDSR